jgi:hypothetical protein
MPVGRPPVGDQPGQRIGRRVEKTKTQQHQTDQRHRKQRGPSRPAGGECAKSITHWKKKRTVPIKPS